MSIKSSELSQFGFSTKTIHCGTSPDPTTGAILTPIYQTATYVQDAIGKHKGFTYSRSANPTVSALERNLGQLEEIDTAVCFATGMAATTTLFLSLLKSGDHIVCSDVVYGGTVRLIRHVLEKFDINVTYVDTSEPKKVEEAIKENTKLLFIETPANPTLKLTDIKALANIARAKKILFVVDNTFLTSALQKPFTLGADIILYSTTKYIDGHNATVGGALLAKDPSITEAFFFNRNAVGSIQSPFDAWLILQGIKTLTLRMSNHSESALIVANHLANHPAISKVIYPGLESFAQHELAKTQQLGFGGMLTFEVVGGYDNAVTFMNSVKLCSLAENLGSIETLVTHPASMTHGPIPIEQRHAVGITDGLIRLSIGLENVEDIIHDLCTALTYCKKGAE